MNPLPDPATPPEPVAPSGTLPTLANLEQISWQELAAVLNEANDKSADLGFRTFVVASQTAHGADARMVVLRQVDTERKYIWFHTDARSEKVLQFEAFPRATLLFWNDKQQIQLRLTAETRLHTDDDVADAHWKALWVGGRKNYLSEYRPGSEQSGPYPGFPEHLGENLPTDAGSEAGRKNFAVIECRVLAMEYLHLSRSGQTRARFQYEPESKMAWLAP